MVVRGGWLFEVDGGDCWLGVEFFGWVEAGFGE